MTKGRIASAVVAVFYVVLAFLMEGAETAFRVIIFLILPLGCIWYGEALGSFTGLMRGQYVNATSPGWLVTFIGWIILLLPLIMAVFSSFSQKQ